MHVPNVYIAVCNPRPLWLDEKKELLSRSKTGDKIRGRLHYQKETKPVGEFLIYGGCERELCPKTTKKNTAVSGYVTIFGGCSRIAVYVALFAKNFSQIKTYSATLTHDCLLVLLPASGGGVCINNSNRAINFLSFSNSRGPNYGSAVIKCGSHCRTTRNTGTTD